MATETVEELAQREYKWGFTTEIDADVAQRIGAALTQQLGAKRQRRCRIAYARSV